MTLTLVLPPLTQLNTPYPSTAYLAGFLESRGIHAVQRDLGIELVLRLFSEQGLAAIFDELARRDELPEPAWRVLALQEQHLRAVDAAIAFLQGRDGSLAPRILHTGLLPVGPRQRRAALDAFGTMGLHDAARYLTTLYLSDLADLVTSCVDEGFGLARYHHNLALSARSFDPLAARLQQTTLVDAMLDSLAESIEADVVGLSVPFPGNLYGALRIALSLKQRGATVWMGGGYVNTELRQMSEDRLWDYVDALTFDDGEGPLLALWEHHHGDRDRRHRTLTREGWVEKGNILVPVTVGGTYGDLPLTDYLQVLDTLNPAHRLWGDGRWNKLTLAHGCYWKKCSFCDVNLDYIGRYEAASAAAVVDQMEQLIEETGQRGFHFVDEAAPPRLLKAVALEILARGLAVTFWGNIRFEKAFTPDLARLLAAAGLVAVTGGLEVANPRLLKLIDKGVTVEQVVGSAAAFREAGVMVHAYLMYGFPTQTVQETIDSMELVRQLFAAGLIQSGFWHRFVLTEHSRIARDPAHYGVEVFPEPGRFARNDLRHEDPTGGLHDSFDDVLPSALAAWLQGEELERPVHTWFSEPMPKTTEPADRVDRCLGAQRHGKRLIWLGGEPLDVEGGLALFNTKDEIFVDGTDDEMEWLGEVLGAARPDEELLLADALAAFPGDWVGFEARWAEVLRVGLVRV